MLFDLTFSHWRHRRQGRASLVDVEAEEAGNNNTIRSAKIPFASRPTQAPSSRIDVKRPDSLEFWRADTLAWAPRSPQPNC